MGKEEEKACDEALAENKEADICLGDTVFDNITDVTGKVVGIYTVLGASTMYEVYVIEHNETIWFNETLIKVNYGK